MGLREKTHPKGFPTIFPHVFFELLLMATRNPGFTHQLRLAVHPLYLQGFIYTSYVVGLGISIIYRTIGQPTRPSYFEGQKSFIFSIGKMGVGKGIQDFIRNSGDQGNY